ncbi:MAG: DUF4139 domain-containing protein [Acetobacter sp.]|nr:DUF4139 domain-containing protein [Acetobacter sp.]
MRLSRVFLTAAVSLAALSVQAAETELTIYNQDLALIKKAQKLNLKAGVNEVVFDEAAKQMRPESAFIYGEGIKVLEQNYDYAGINYITMLNANIGKEVKTVRQNPANGKNIFEKAILLAVDGMTPVLKFDYGVESNFNGRVVFDEVPFGLNSEPVLKAKVQTVAAGEKELNLAYLANGFSWQANYVAKVNDGDTLSILGRVSLNNASGSNYNDVAVNLIAGDVNVVNTMMQPRMYKMAMKNTMASGAMMDGAVAEATMEAPESLNGYYVYKIPQKTSLKDGQIKQVSFIEAPKVKYKKRGEINSGLYFHTAKSYYKDVHPTVVYNFANNKDDGLGMPLPKGKVSFYDTDKSGAIQFVGENTIDNKAEGQKITVKLGKFFDVYANGKVEKIKEVGEPKQTMLANGGCRSSQTYAYDVVYDVTNKSAEAVDIVLKQSLPDKAKILDESLKGTVGDGNVYEWRFTVDAGKSQELKVQLENVIERSGCEGKIVLD